MFSSVHQEPPVAHATHRWDDESRSLHYDYNGRTLITLLIPEEAKPYYRTYSNGNIQSRPFIQQLYLVLDRPATVQVRFQLSGDALSMRPHRAHKGQAILGQVGKPLLHGVNGLYDVLDDLLIDWHGAQWRWTNPRLERNADGNWQAELEIEAGLQPWIFNLRMQYYRMHLQYEHHKPWQWRPQLKPITGWSSWEAFAQRVTGEDIDRTAAFLDRHFKSYGLQYMQIDDGYQTEPIPPEKDGIVADSWLQPNGRFPGGHESLVASIRSRGFEAGIWTSAMVTNDGFAEANRGLFERNADGDPLHGEWIFYVLKGELESLAGQVAPLYEGLKEKGYSYFKTDQIRHYLYDGLHKAVNDGILTQEEASAQLRTYLRCAREQLGDNAYFLACWGVLTEAVGIVDACRIAGDSNPSWPAICKQIVESARWYHTQRILYLNDPDYACMRTEEAWGKTLLSLISLSGGLLMISDDTDLYDAGRIHAIQRCMPALPTATGETGPLDMSFPLDISLPRHSYGADSDEAAAAAFALLGMSPVSNDSFPTASLWAFHFDLPHRQWCVAGRFGVVPVPSVEQKLDALALDPNETYHVFDFWKQRYAGKAKQTLPLEALELGHCQIVALTKAEARPQLIGSSRHVSMDAVSVRQEAWDNGQLLLELNGVKGTTETYWIAVPDASRYDRHSASGLLIADAAAADDGVLKVSVTFEEENGSVRLFFS